VGDCDMGRKQCQALSKGVGRSASLTELDLSCNKIRAGGARGLGAALAASSTLTSLRVRNCGLNRQVCRAMSEGVGSSVSLTELDLGSNMIEVDSARALATALSASTTLTSLLLSDCSIGGKECRALSEGVGRSVSFTELDLGDEYAVHCTVRSRREKDNQIAQLQLEAYQLMRLENENAEIKTQLLQATSRADSQKLLDTKKIESMKIEMHGKDSEIARLRGEAYGVEVHDVDGGATRVVDLGEAGAETALKRIRKDQAVKVRVTTALQTRLVEVKNEKTEAEEEVEAKREVVAQVEEAMDCACSMDCACFFEPRFVLVVSNLSRLAQV
jgi:hypothetical protein